MTPNVDLKNKVAREAATLLYFGVEKEYKQAKVRAAETFGTHFLPSNLEIAFELDKVAEENEGDDRKKRLVEMRKQALKLMKLLNDYSPVLIGSVWRGTARKESDIDIAVYSDDPKQVLDVLRVQGVNISKAHWVSVNKQGKTLESFHVLAAMSTNFGFEIVVRSSEEAQKSRTCEIFGDEIKGLNTRQLARILENDACEKFLPHEHSHNVFHQRKRIKRQLNCIHG